MLIAWKYVEFEILKCYTSWTLSPSSTFPSFHVSPHGSHFATRTLTSNLISMGLSFLICKIESDTTRLGDWTTTTTTYYPIAIQQQMIYMFNMCVCLVMSDSSTPCTVAHQAPPSREFSMQEYWSRLPFPTPE